MPIYRNIPPKYLRLYASSQKQLSKQFSFIGLVYRKIYWKTPYLMLKTMIFCRFSLKPTQWFIKRPCSLYQNFHMIFQGQGQAWSNLLPGQVPVLFFAGWFNPSSHMDIYRWQSKHETTKQVLKIVAGWWLTYPSEKWWSSSVGIIVPNWMESHNPFMFQSPPTSIFH